MQRLSFIPGYLTTENPISNYTDTCSPFRADHGAVSGGSWQWLVSLSAAPFLSPPKKNNQIKLKDLNHPLNPPPSDENSPSIHLPRFLHHDDSPRGQGVSKRRRGAESRGVFREGGVVDAGSAEKKNKSSGWARRKGEFLCWFRITSMYVCMHACIHKNQNLPNIPRYNILVR